MSQRPTADETFPDGGHVPFHPLFCGVSPRDAERTGRPDVSENARTGLCEVETGLSVDAGETDAQIRDLQRENERLREAALRALRGEYQPGSHEERNRLLCENARMAEVIFTVGELLRMSGLLSEEHPEGTAIDVMASDLLDGLYSMGAEVDRLRGVQADLHTTPPREEPIPAAVRHLALSVAGQIVSAHAVSVYFGDLVWQVRLAILRAAVALVEGTMDDDERG